jgi:hypothetical protein
MMRVAIVAVIELNRRGVPLDIIQSIVLRVKSNIVSNTNNCDILIQNVGYTDRFLTEKYKLTQDYVDHALGYLSAKLTIIGQYLKGSPTILTSNGHEIYKALIQFKPATTYIITRGEQSYPWTSAPKYISGCLIWEFPNASLWKAENLIGPIKDLDHCACLHNSPCEVETFNIKINGVYKKVLYLHYDTESG